MCLFRRQLDAKSRRIMAAGNICLFSCIMLNVLAQGFVHHHPVAFNSLRFLLLLSAIGLLFWFARRSGGCMTPPERKS
jgi:hypothetical protein